MRGLNLPYRFHSLLHLYKVHCVQDVLLFMEMTSLIDKYPAKEDSFTSTVKCYLD